MWKCLPRTDADLSSKIRCRRSRPCFPPSRNNPSLELTGSLGFHSLVSSPSSFPSGQLDSTRFSPFRCFTRSKIRCLEGDNFREVSSFRFSDPLTFPSVGEWVDLASKRRFS
uniref:(northern house mosquito) hypothetical protein n=1 Tax=Culex pipiens TaxID=7175 RepID=A0A8D8DJC7_CULPI